MRARVRLGLLAAVLAAAVLSLPPTTGSRATSLNICSDNPDRNWDGGGDGASWHDPLNWEPNGLPQPGEHICIEVAGAPTVVLSEGTQTVASLESAEPLVISGAELELTDTEWDSKLVGTTLTDSGTLAGAGTRRALRPHALARRNDDRQWDDPRRQRRDPPDRGGRREG